MPGSGAGGTSQGAYDLRLDFQPDAVSGLVSAGSTAYPGGVPFDGDADGNPGGTYNFWFAVEPSLPNMGTVQPNTPYTIYVDKDNGLLYTPPMNSNPGSLANPYTTIQAALGQTVTGSVVRIIGNSQAQSNDAYAYNIGTDLLNKALPDGATMAIPLGVTVMVDNGGPGSTAVFKLSHANINVGTVSQGLPKTGGALQILGTPSSGQAFLVNPIQAAPNGIKSGDTVTVTSNADVTTTFQFLTMGNTVANGDVAVNFTLGSTPSQLAALLAAAINGVHNFGVTATSAAGLVKLTGAAGLTSATTGVTIDNGLNDVIFTSYNDQSVAPLSNPLVAAPSPGDWGGIVFNGDADNEAQGIFVDTVDHATIKYGGGQVIVNSTEQVTDAINLTDSRPSIQFNTILDSADAAMSGDPNSFADSEFAAAPISRACRTITPISRPAPATRTTTIAPARPYTATSCRAIRSTACSCASARRRAPVSTSLRCRPLLPIPISATC